ncbi:NPCBM/NEW2 domain-containing protein [Lactobacillus iners]|uniref:NPCBM/NEW2 domain-containing protein n=1 Tax=Lactobacillus iners TaxID=147802 RepID=UPI000C9A83C5|nr:NPCBM/NEW2 domain-containing protein [Lactobacillus iners]MDK8317319.1 NPCBM/NEW2 domain-containing protein [Lactobacillus iners]MDK8324068.1 NPCBM/NEW2 domain-containing protein [Lactobacillus iners]MDK8581932.1 NPCBM/NEW2 domain-containing protein [Lactobacillus iners]PMC46745.1 carbohydrate-binding protein [Lactobacillus iners]
MKKCHNTKLTSTIYLASLLAGGIYYNNAQVHVYASVENPKFDQPIKVDQYLEDIPFVQAPKVGWGSYKVDQTLDGKKIKLKINGQEHEFAKGITAHADACLIYDLSKIKSNIFETYLGIDDTKTGEVEFRIYLDDELYYASGKVNRNNTQHILMNIAGKKQLKIIVDSLGYNGSDHSILADPKFYFLDLKDKKIPDLANENPGFSYNKINDAPYNLNFEQYYFLKRMGKARLFSYMMTDKSNIKYLNWLFNNLSLLHSYNTASLPRGGNQIGFLKVFKELLDHDPDLKSDSEKQKIAMAVALEYANGNINFWANSNLKSDPIKRYDIYSTLNNTPGALRPIFKTLSVELLRHVVNAEISDEDIIWIRDKIKRENPQLLFNNDELSNATYKYIAYNPFNKYGDDVQKGGFYGDNPTLEKVVELGGVCGSVSKFDVVVLKSFGVPANVIGQPGHAAVTYMRDDGSWTRRNEIYSWGRSQGGTATLLAGGSSGYNTTYNILASDILKDKGNYQQALKYYEFYKNVQPGLLKNSLAEKITTLVPCFVPVYRDQINELKDNRSATAKDYYELSKKILSTFKNYPKVMFDLLSPLKKGFAQDRYLLTDFAINYIQQVDSVTNSIARDVMKEDEYQKEYNSYNSVLGDFSFSGKNRYNLKNVHPDTEYSFDGGITWHSSITNSPSLTSSEIAQLNTKYGILLRLKGMKKAIQIKLAKQVLPSFVRADDQENIIVGLNHNMEYSLDNGQNWINGNVVPDLSGKCTVLVREKAANKSFASDVKKLEFTNDNQIADDIMLGNMKVVQYSSQQNDTNQAAVNTINGTGTANNFWHTKWAGDSNRYITIGFNKEYTLKKFYYTPRLDNGENGNILKYEIYISNDGKQFTKVKAGEFTYSSPNYKSPKVVELPDGTKTKYFKLKIISAKGTGSYAAATKFAFEIPHEEAVAAYQEKQQKAKQQFNSELVEDLKNFKNNVESLSKLDQAKLCLGDLNLLKTDINKLDTKNINYIQELNKAKKRYDLLRDEIIIKNTIYQKQNDSKLLETFNKNNQQILTKSITDVTDKDINIITSALKQLKEKPEYSQIKTNNSEIILGLERKLLRAQDKKLANEFKQQFKTELELNEKNVSLNDYNNIVVAYYNLLALSSEIQGDLNNEKTHLYDLLQFLEKNAVSMQNDIEFKKNNNEILSLSVDKITLKNLDKVTEQVNNAFYQYNFLNSFDKARLKASKEHLDALQSKILTFENIKAKENLLSQLQQFKNSFVNESDEIKHSWLQEYNFAKSVATRAVATNVYYQASAILLEKYEELSRTVYLQKDNIAKANKFKERFSTLLNKDISKISIDDKKLLASANDQWRRQNEATLALLTDERAKLDAIEDKIASTQANYHTVIDDNINKLITQLKKDRNNSYSIYKTDIDNILQESELAKKEPDLMKQRELLLDIKKKRSSILAKQANLKDKVTIIHNSLLPTLKISPNLVTPADRDQINSQLIYLNTLTPDIKASLGDEKSTLENLINKINEIEQSPNKDKILKLIDQKVKAEHEIRAYAYLSYKEIQNYLKAIDKASDSTTVVTQLQGAQKLHNQRDASAKQELVILKNKIKSILNDDNLSKMEPDNQAQIKKIKIDDVKLDGMTLGELSELFKYINNEISLLKSKDQSEKEFKQNKINYDEKIKDINQKISEINHKIVKLKECDVNYQKQLGDISNKVNFGLGLNEIDSTIKSLDKLSTNVDASLDKQAKAEKDKLILSISAAKQKINSMNYLTNEEKADYLAKIDLAVSDDIVNKIVSDAVNKNHEKSISVKPVTPVKPKTPSEPEVSVKQKTPSEPEASVTPVQPQIPSKPEVPVTPEQPKTSSLPEVTVKPETPKIPSKPKVPVTPEQPQTPSVPEVSVKPETPKTPSVPEVPVKPEQPKTSSVPEVSVTPDKPNTPSVPEAPVTPEKPQTPSVPKVPVKPVKPKTPSVPEVSVTPETPKTPSVPEVSVKPETSKTPSVPETPVTPEQPKTPSVPEVSVKPKTQSAPETPVTPEQPKTPSVPKVSVKPETPKIPSKPKVPVTPEQPKTPSAPEVSVKPETPKTPSEPEVSVKPVKPNTTSVPEVSVKPVKPKTPSEPEVPVTPVQPQIPSKPEVPVTPVQPQIPSKPEVPVTPEQPKTPSVPEVSVKPEKPQTPSVPEVTVKPEKPQTPSKPEVTVTPEQPQTPSVPEVPVTPETPKTPSVPETPETPEKPQTPSAPEVTDKPKTPSAPEVTVKPEQPKAPSVPEVPAKKANASTIVKSQITKKNKNNIVKKKSKSIFSKFKLIKRHAQKNKKMPITIVSTAVLFLVSLIAFWIRKKKK